MGKDEPTRPFTLVISVLAAIGVVALLVPAMIGNQNHDLPGAEVPSTLRSLSTAQELFRENDKEGDGTRDYGTLAELAQAKLIDPALGTGTRYGYLFRVQPGAAPEHTWWATATPTPELQRRSTYARSFFANHEGSIWYTTDGGAAPITSHAAPPPGWKLAGR